MTVMCQFGEEIQEASCVLVYREYGDETLVVVEYPQNSTVFPVTVTVDHPGDYTFAIFGKRSFEFDQKPMETRRMQVNGATPSSPPSSPPSTPSTSVPPPGIFCWELNYHFCLFLIRERKSGRVGSYCWCYGDSNSDYNCRGVDWCTSLDNI